MIRLRRPWRAIALYLGLVIVFSAPWTALLIAADSLDIGRGFVVHTLMWSPGLAALATCALTGTPIAFLGFRWPRFRFLAWGYLLPVIYAVPAYLALWASGLAPAAFADFAAASADRMHVATFAGSLTVVLTMTFGVLQSAVSAAGEEIGWRGFLVPALAERLNAAGVVIVSGLIWAAWHMPLILFSAYNSAAPKWFALICFTVMIVATGGLYGWLRLRSRSVWPAVLAHACHNALIQWLLDAMTVETGRPAWFAGEFGIALAVTATIVLAIAARLGWHRIGARDQRQKLA